MQQRVNMYLSTLFSFLCGCNLNHQDNYEVPRYEICVNQVSNQFADEIEKEFGFHCSSSGGSMPHDIERISIGFQVPRKVTLDEARSLHVQLVERLIKRINENEAIRPYLREYPVRSNNAHISLSFIDETYLPHKDGSICRSFNYRGLISYLGQNANDKLFDIAEEPYEEAKRKVYPNLEPSPYPEKVSSFAYKVQPMSDTFLFGPSYPAILPALEEYEKIRYLCTHNPPIKISQAVRELTDGVSNTHFDKDLIENLSHAETTCPDGEYVECWPNGQLKIRASWKQGLANGHLHGWFADGSEAFKGYFRNGIKVGGQIIFYPPEIRQNFINSFVRLLNFNEEGLADGEQIAKFPRGLKVLTVYKKGLQENLTTILLTPSGQTLEILFKEGKEIPKE